ncbi:MAG: EamA family transporter [Pseudonocardia sp.]|nr:EamA family transporter [Pseudonocardia sp.]
MTRRGVALFALMGILWGVPYMMIKVAIEGVSVPVLVFARTALAALVLLPLAMRGGQLAALRPYWKPIALFAILEMIIPWFLIVRAEHDITSSMTGLLIAASPIFTVAVARMLGRGERLGIARSAGLGIGLAGVAVLAGPELSGGSPRAIVEVLIVAVCYATGPHVAARRLQDVPALPMTAACLGFAALVYAAPAAATWPAQLPDVRVLAAIGGLALICTALAFIVFFALIREVGPSRALVFTYINPAVAVAAGVTLLGEPLTATMIAAFVLILAGSVLATRTAKAVEGAPAAQPVAATP